MYQIEEEKCSEFFTRTEFNAHVRS